MQYTKKIIIFLLFNSILMANFNAQYFNQKANKYKVQKKYLSAIEYYKKSIQKNKNYVPALINLGIILREIGKYKEALTWLQKAKKLSTDKKIQYEIILTLIKNLQIQKAKKLTLKELKKNPFDFRLKFLKSEIYIYEKRFYLARKILQQIIKSKPGFFDAYISLGKLYLKQNDYYRAQKYLNKAKLIHPENPDILIYLAKIELAKIFHNKKEMFDSLEYNFQIFNKPLNILLNSKKYNNSLQEANLLIGKIYALNKKCNDAIPYFNTVLKLNPSHFVANYYLGYCNTKQSISIYKDILSRNSNNEIVRFFYEENLLKTLNRRENPLIMKQTRYHYKRGKNLLKTNFLIKGINEIRWSQYLYPKFKKSHLAMLSYYRMKKDLFHIGKELHFLKTFFPSRKFDDYYEQFIRYRNNTIFYKEGFKNPLNVKNRKPIFLFFLKPQNEMTDFPNAGRAIIKKTLLELKYYGKITILNSMLREQLYNKLLSQNYFGDGGYYNSITNTFVQNTINTYQNRHPIKIGEDNNFDIKRNRLKYILAGTYIATRNSMKINVYIKNIETGEILNKKSFISSNRGFLRNISIQLAQFIYTSIPFRADVIKINNQNIIINSGKRDGLKNKDKLIMIRNHKQICKLKIIQTGYDLSVAIPLKQNDIYKIRKGDKVYLNK